MGQIPLLNNDHDTLLICPLVTGFSALKFCKARGLS